MQWSSSRGIKVTSSSWSWRGIVDEREISCRRCLPAHYLDIVIPGNLGPAGTRVLGPEHQFLSRPPNKSQFAGLFRVSTQRLFVSAEWTESCVLCTYCLIISVWWIPRCLMTSFSVSISCSGSAVPGLGKGIGWPQLRSESSKHKQQPGLTAEE